MPDLEERYISEEKCPFQELAVFSRKLLKADGPRLYQFGLACPSGENFYPIERLKRLTAQVLRTQPDILKAILYRPALYVYVLKLPDEAYS